MRNANDRQVGGVHYSRAQIQHWDFATRNGMCYLAGCATKYMTRNRKKHDTPEEDLRKAVHYTEKLIEEYRAGHVLAPGPRKDTIPVQEFAEANSLTGDEAAFIFDLTYWNGEKELREALSIAQKLLAEAIGE